MAAVQPQPRQPFSNKKGGDPCPEPPQFHPVRDDQAALQQTATRRIVRDSPSEDFGLPPGRTEEEVREGPMTRGGYRKDARRSQKFLW